MNSMLKKIVSVALCFIMIIICIPISASAKNGGTNYPYVFVHGMMGWGNYDEINNQIPYWGTTNGNVIKSLEEKGIECYTASVGKISSNWDRACELYAQLTGTVVDYGKAHGHARYGRSYEGNALMDSFGKTDENGNLIKINLFGHSMGGPTVRLFTYLLANGCEEELNASPDDASEFFKGGKGDYIYSVTTWSAPHNGAPASNTLYDKLPTAFILSLMGNILGTSSNPALWDFQLEQYGLTSVPSQEIKGKMFNFSGINKFIKSDDNCGYDLTLRGAKALNDMIDTVDGIYYFSYTGQKVIEQADGTYRPAGDMFPLFTVFSRQMGKFNGEVIDGITMTEKWRQNDGMVPVISGMAPFDEESVLYEDVKDSGIEPGIWHIMPLIDNFSHVSYMGMDTDNFEYLYLNQAELINAL